MFIQLTTHSAYSLQEGLLLPSEIVQAAMAYGMPALGMTDHWLLSGTVEFVTACQKAEIQPIIGLEIDLETSPLSLFASSIQGWRNLCQLSSALALREQPESHSSLDLLAENADDLIAISSINSEKCKTIFPVLKEMFNDCLYIALQTTSQILPASKLSHTLKIPLVVAPPVYYLERAQRNLFKTMAAIRKNKTLNDISLDTIASQATHFDSPSDILNRFNSVPEALNATQEIAQRCKFDFPVGRIHMPTVSLPTGVSPAQVLREKAEEGAIRLYGSITAKIQSRLDHELDVISSMGYEPIFLIMEEILAYARENHIPFSSRGSAASSLVAHCLNITEPDPLQLNLYFERFLNPARATPPDIDTDLCSRRRDQVIKYVFTTFGSKRAAMVGTINRYRPRSALTDVAKAHGLSQTEVRKMVKYLPHSFFSRMQESQDQISDKSPFDILRQNWLAKDHLNVLDEAEALLKLPRHLSVHAGGLIIAPGKLTDYVPVMRSGSKGIVITQMDLESVELLGLVKIDLLGIRALTVLLTFIKIG